MFTDETQLPDFDKPALQQCNVKRRSFIVDFDVDWKFFAILPALNINLHVRGFEFEWLFFGVYVRFCSNGA